MTIEVYFQHLSFLRRNIQMRIHCVLIIERLIFKVNVQETCIMFRNIIISTNYVSIFFFTIIVFKKVESYKKLISK